MSKRTKMDPTVRESAIETVTRYARLGNDPFLLELVGFNTTRHDITDEQETAAIVAVLPLLTDERLNILMRHIAEVLVEGVGEKAVA